MTLHILVVDDSPKHRRAAQSQLAGPDREVVALADYVEAWERAQAERFDVALLDLLMPAEGLMLGDQGRQEHLGREIGVGFPLVLAMGLCDIPLIGMITDTNHHAHPMSALVDWFADGRRPLRVNNSAVLICHAHLRADGTKDWLRAYQALVAL
ncbi:MAG: response regulator [Patescibacteria group bacterium]